MYQSFRTAQVSSACVTSFAPFDAGRCRVGLVAHGARHRSGNSDGQGHGVHPEEHGDHGSHRKVSRVCCHASPRRETRLLFIAGSMP